MHDETARRPRIAHVTPYYWPTAGGITNYVHSVAEAQRRMHAEVRILTKRPGAGRDVQAGPHNNILFSRWAFRRLREWRPDIVHAHADWSALAATQGLWRSAAPRTVFSLHTDFGPAKNAAREAILRRLMGRADVVTAMNQRSLRELEARFPGLRGTALIRPGTDAGKPDLHASGSTLAAYGLEGCCPKICAVSMMVWPEKVEGLKLLVRAMEGVALHYPKARLIIVGDGPLRGEVEHEIAAAKAGSSVTLVGKQTNPPEFVAASDIFAHISFRDAFPQVVLDALSICRPVVVNEEVALNLPSALLDTGVLVVKSSATAISEAVVRLWQDSSLRTDVSTRGQALVRTEYSWDKIASDLMVLYGIGEGGSF